jgi:hypothetical protein
MTLFAFLWKPFHIGRAQIFLALLQVARIFWRCIAPNGCLDGLFSG